jgi:medium-chain acyl-[acyl-carrier-protein] hydrolase
MLIDSPRSALTPAAGNTSWFQRSRNDLESRLRLFCFPYAGGGAAIFRKWSRELGPEIAVTPALLPGREARVPEPLCTRLESVIEPLTRQIAPYLDRPFAFFGHSMGGLLAYELTRRVRAEHGVEPDHLFISAKEAPQLTEKDQRRHELPEPEFLAMLQSLNGTPREVLAHAELREIFVPLMRADFAVCDTYSYVPDLPLQCPITVLGGTQDEQVSPGQLEGWAEQTTGEFQLKMLTGDHFFINHAQLDVLDVVGKTLQPLLQEDR